MPTQSDEEKSPSPTAEVCGRGLQVENATFPGYWPLPWKQKCNTELLTNMSKTGI
jgi:hypothetical protein